MQMIGQKKPRDFQATALSFNWRICLITSIDREPRSHAIFFLVLRENVVYFIKISSE